MEEKAPTDEISEKLSSDELAWRAFLLSMGTVGVFIVVAFVFIIL